LKTSKGVIAAITAAVLSYMAEEEALRPKALVPRKSVVVPKPWANFGREEIMRMRTLWQLRIVPKW